MNLFTNGILFGDKGYCDHWLPRWRILGLTNVVVSVHDVIHPGVVYGVENYPKLETIFDNIKSHGVGVRVTLLLSKNFISNAFEYQDSVKYLLDLGIDNITSWPAGNPDGSRNEYSPSRLGMLGIRWWLKRNAKLCHGHVWGGGVFDYCGNILRLTDYVTRHDPKLDFVRQLVVFQDGTVAYSWIKEGALCMK